ncbi:MAG: hypothetical protein FDZ70_02590, partial [Actinobacteria bacterium]
MSPEGAVEGAGRSGFLARPGARDAVAFALALLTYVAVGGGLIDPDYAPATVTGIALGVVAGLAAGSVPWAA